MNLTSTLIGFTGRPYSGKDTCAQLLSQHGFHRAAFADVLRHEVAEAWRIDMRLLSEPSTKEWPQSVLAVRRCWDLQFVKAMAAAGHDTAEPRSPRWIMQRWGTEYRRAQSSRYWLDHIARWVGQQRAAGLMRLCITDVRFADEAALLRSLGGRIVQVHRPELPARDADTVTHISELSVPADVAIHNDGDLEHLRAELIRALEQLAEERRA